MHIMRPPETHPPSHTPTYRTIILHDEALDRVIRTPGRHVVKACALARVNGAKVHLASGVREREHPPRFVRANTFVIVTHATLPMLHWN